MRCYATHLMGGWAGYEYLGLNSATGDYKYQVTVKVYRYCQDNVGPCGSNACNTAVLDPTIQLGAYTQDFLNPNDPNKVLTRSFVMPLATQSWVPLPGSAQCTTAPVVCVQEGIYTMQIELPSSNGGYHLFFERCCRNGNIINLSNPGAEGMSFYAFVPPTFVNNSSPTFALPPVPYICVNDTASILNTAFDPDGDVIVYSLVRPFSGRSSSAVAAPPPPNPYVFPIPLVTYSGGYNAAQPFGAGGYASVNSFTGLSKYLSPSTGNFVVAVDLQEFRNNQLIGVTRLDIQIIVINCPPNNPPVLSSTTSQISYTANSGDSLCFPITFSDINGDSIFLTASGNLFNAPTAPPATLTPNPHAGIGTITSQFCWDIPCGLTGNYIFIVQSPDNGCPPKVANVVYTIQILPYTGPTSISGPSPLCLNSSGTYSVPATSGTTFTWTVTNGTIASGQGTNSININWGASGNGTVNVTSYNLNGCSSGPISLNVNLQAAPVITTGTNSTICAGNPVTLTSSGGSTYSWRPATGLSNQNISNPVASPTTSTNYTVTGTTAIGCTNTNTVAINVRTPSAVNAGADVSLCIGNSTTLNATGTGNFLWSPSTGLSCTTCANPVAAVTSTTNYTVTLTDAFSCTNTDVVRATLNPIPLPAAGPRPGWVCPGFGISLNSSNGVTYSWSPSASLNNPSISNPVASPTGNTTYTVNITDVNGCAGRDTLTIRQTPSVPTNAGNNLSICNGQSVTLGGNPTAPPAATYQWSPTAGLNNSTLANPVASPVLTTTYIVATSSDTCNGLDTVIIFVNTAAAISAGADISICSSTGTSVTLNASGGSSYSWSTGATTASIAVTPTSATTYTVTGTNANGCTNSDVVSVSINSVPAVSAGADISLCSGTAVTLTGSGAQSYSWSTGASTTSISFVPSSSATYTVIGTDANGCTNIDSVSVLMNGLPVVSAGPDVTVCSGTAATLTGSGGQIYSWSPAGTLNNGNVSNPVATPTITTTYTLTSTDANSCSNTDAVRITVVNIPVSTVSNDTAVCAGKNVSLNATGGGSYSWSPSVSLNNAAISNPIATPTSTTTYLLSVTNSGCATTHSVTVVVNQLPNIDAGPNIVICSGISVTLNATGGIAYNWSPSTGLSNPTISNPVAAATGITTYTVIGTDGNGCTKTDMVTVSSGIIPIANFGYDLTLACDGMKAHFSDSSLNATSWAWNFGDGNSSSQQNPTHVFPYGSNYAITLIAANQPCTDTAQTTILVNGLSSYLNLESSTVFTPNSDGVNDCFRINTNGRFEGCADLTIYDRWGVPVYHSEYSGSCWDGYTSAGAVVPAGTYFYMFDLNGIQLKGFVTVLR